MGRYRLHQMRESAMRRAGRPMSRMACASCATYLDEEDSWMMDGWIDGSIDRSMGGWID